MIIVGIKKAHGKMVFNPHSQAKIEGGDTLIVLGEPGSIAKLEDLVDRTATDEVIQEAPERPGQCDLISMPMSPIPGFPEHLEYIVANRINPEVFFSAQALDHVVWEELSAQARVLHTRRPGHNHSRPVSGPESRGSRPVHPRGYA